jgi:hypothetical protein
MNDPSVGIRWRCMICDESRPDEEIAVRTKPGHIGRVYAVQNVRHCRDRQPCMEAAETFTVPLPGWQPLPEVVCRAFPGDNERANLVSMVPEHLHEGMGAYVWHGRRTGDFLRSVFEGNLFEAAMRADGFNNPALAEIAKFVIWHFPPIATGSPAAVEQWVASGGMSRYLDRQRQG